MGDVCGVGIFGAVNEAGNANVSTTSEQSEKPPSIE